MKQARRSYLDFNATAPLRPEARDACRAALDLTGNPSSIHAEGRAARALIEEARAAVARLAGAPPQGVAFTASGTEAANLALTPAIVAPVRAPPVRLIASAGEHTCVLKGHRFAVAAVERAPLCGDGRIDLDALAEMLARSGAGPAMLALQGANNETGVIQPVAEAAALVHAAGGVVVCDAVQLAGRAPATISELGADFLVLSAHKLGGPKGAGALVAAPGMSIAEPLVRGGGQERGLRAGTENVAAIAGFGAAARAAMAEGAGEGEAARLAELREALAAQIAAIAPDAVIFGATAPRLSNTLCFAAPGVAAETLLIALDLAGIAVSSGSACSSGKVSRSHVLDAMQVDPKLAGGAIRLSLGWSSDEADVAHFGEAFAQIIARIRRGRSAA